ncbi:protein of unknown function [Vibrio xiamenensis]|uniref:Toxin VasX N-terminal region domain-containing protein n=1 Tax=Vibrio xiamenensis TaxID=861298 RepID=A0A1G8CLC7_9VIBR|nr:PAAR-like domain-containing protein [Vibrio xiamenensis]SDH46149.1 protein of unknown function [Vibrio xiamenensis]
MSVTINANGLSIVHQGSEGEANASLPDVCKTQCGPAVVPIPYGNNAKSADLADGTTTVFADGGNSIAIDGSKFSQSTGDASGDKKGIVSGTIEGEAQFVTSSPTVIIEGKGVARHSDQMTMNKANTMCLGVQNPSVSVEESPAEPSQVDIKVRYPNGTLLTNAPFQLTDESSAALGDGTLCEQGKGSVDGLQPGKVKLQVAESNDAFVVAPKLRTNPYYREQLQDQDFFDLASKGQQTFWQPQRIASSMMGWGSMGKDLTTDRYFHEMLQLETQAYFAKGHPSYELDKIGYAAIQDIAEQTTASIDTVVVYTLPMMVEEGDILSVLFRLAPHETTDRMLAYMRARGKGNPQSYLSDYDWDTTKKQMTNTLQDLLSKVTSRIETLAEEARRLNYTYLSADIFDAHISDLNAYIKGLPDRVAESFSRLADKAQNLLVDVSNVQVIKAHDNVYSAEAGVVEAVVNTTANVDIVDPYLNEEPGSIVNVQPIYPVRYGYANFFDEVMPAQAPPSMTTMSSATGLKDTGGYLLRLLREGWIYIKEESDEENAPFHIFKYAQTQTPTGVIEKFERYVFTNQENAQGGLTLDTTSGSTFYPFAFVTPKAKKISIVYSEHQWSSALIDNMNSDETLRQEAMQQVDLSSPQTEFSQAATKENLSSLVEEYRNNDKKWLLSEVSNEDDTYAPDALRIYKNYSLSADGLIESLQKSHYEQKNGTLVALFDPIGRQTDLAFAMSLITAKQKSDEAKTFYPASIGTIINKMREKGSADVVELINENVDTDALDAFTKKSDMKKAKNKQSLELLLDLYAQFAYKDLADGTIGSLDNYLKMFFDAENVTSADAVNEAEKLSLITQGLFESLSSNEEGQRVLVEMINSAYENDQGIADSNNIAYIVFESLKKFFLQCQEQVDWHIAVKNLPIVFGKLWAEAKAGAKYGGKIINQSKNHLAAKALSKLVDSFIPIFFEKVYGIIETGNTVRVSRQRLSEALTQIIDSGGKNSSKITSSMRQLSRAKSMFGWAEDQKHTRLAGYIEQAEIKVIFEHGEYNGRISTIKAPTDFFSMGADAALAGVSWYFNLMSLYDVYAQGDVDSADPLRNTFYMYEDMKMLGALSAFLVDTAALSRAGLIFSNKYILESSTSHLAQRLLPKSTSVLKTLGLWAERKVFARLTAGANVAMVFVSLSDAYESYENGNTGEMLGHLTMATGSLMLAGGAAYTFSSIGWAMAFGFFAFAIIVIGGVLVWLYSKSHFEQLLSSCFWGRNKRYAFWYFESGGELNIRSRLDMIQRFYDKNEFKFAYSIEVQEFMNFLIKPSVKVEEDNGLFSGVSKYKFSFTLPNFVWKVSEVVASIHKKVINPYQQKPQAYDYEFNEQATKAFSNAISTAMNNNESHMIKDGTLTLTFEVEMEEDCVLHWYYQPSPNLVVPKRSLSDHGKITKTFLGMRNNDLIN